MSLRLRRATDADVPALMPRTTALQEHEHIVIDQMSLETALREMVGDPSLGVVFVVEREDTIVGYAFLSFSFDLEFGGREAWLTELYIDETARGTGAGTFALAAIEIELRALGVRAYHLQVRDDNPAMRLYQRVGFERVPRTIMSKRL